MRADPTTPPSKTLKRLGAGALGALLLASVAVAQTTGQAAAPKLAPNVKAQEAYEPAPASRYVVALPGPIHTDIMWTSPANGELELGDTVNAIAKVKNWDWVVVARDGVGVGYVPLDRLRRADSGRG
jgi:hypothetical protein